jgi:uncharacterized membrane protein HdeD (DUF308 family)
MAVSERASHGPTNDEIIEREVRRVIRRWAWCAAIASVLVGVVGVAFPQRTLQAVALVVGTYFIVTGIGRVGTAFDSPRSLGGRVVVGILGAAVVVAGVLCLNNPFGTTAALDVLIGIGLIIDGAACLGIAFLIAERGTRATLVVSGAISVVAGVVVLVTRTSTLTGLLFIAAICFLVLGLATLASLIATRRNGART